MSIRSKKDLELELSKLHTFQNPSFELEQYATPAHIAADWLWTMAMRGELARKTILDAACGPGILGLAALLMGAKKVFFVDKDVQSMQLCIQNYQQLEKEYELGEAKFITQDISLFNEMMDVVIQNPPFGTKNEHADKQFLEKAFTLAPLVYSMHKYSTKKFIEAITKDFKFEITHIWRYDFPLKAAFKFHEKPVVKIDVGLWRTEKEI